VQRVGRRWPLFVAVVMVLLPLVQACGRSAAQTPASVSQTPVSASASASPAPNTASPMMASVSPSVAGASTTAASASPTALRFDHVVIVVLENKDRGSVLGTREAPYLTALAARGANLTNYRGITHPSQPNYIALFSGSQHGITSDACPANLGNADNLGRQLLDHGLTFVGYAESLPDSGFAGCSSNDYRRKHNPWVNFANLPASVNQPFSAFPSDFGRLPTVALVVPNMCNDMHDCSVRTGDDWVRKNFDEYATWATTNRSLLVITFDENEGGATEPIATILVGQSIQPGSYDQLANHYSLLRTIEDSYGLPPLGAAATATPLPTISRTAR
jgi:Phosphoesterase family